MTNTTHKRFAPLLLVIGVLVFFTGCNGDDVEKFGSKAPTTVSLRESVYYYVDLNRTQDDKFRVKGYVSNLTEANKIYQFPAVVPGTYRIADIGRYVSDFTAYDATGKKIGAEQISTNQWEFSNPGEVASFAYAISETWDTSMDSYPIYLMAGTSIEADHVLFNSFAVLGYPEGLKDREYYLAVDYPKDWVVGTSLEESAENVYKAQNYAQFVDSPLLLGNLTAANVTVGRTDINVFTYSATNQVTAGEIIVELEGIMQDAEAFLKVLPVDRYSFLFHFGERSAGALEHSYSSVYVLREAPLSANYKNSIKSISAHEFFHVVTPLNIHSEIIEDFNFATPTPSAHLWLYEGVTEWASDMMQFRNGSMDIARLLIEFDKKTFEYEVTYDKTLSLEQMSKTVFGEGGSQFSNIYNKGAMVACLMDIRLLELSGGKAGLRELILDLIDIFGPQNSFQDDELFQIIEDMTYPEIGDFITRYISGSEELPIKEYFVKIGIDYEPIENDYFIIESLSAEQQNLYNRWSVNL